MKKADRNQPTAWAQGYHPTQAPPACPYGANQRNISAGFTAQHHTPPRRLALTLTLGFLLMAWGMGILLQPLLQTQENRQAEIALQRIYDTAIVQAPSANKTRAAMPVPASTADSAQVAAPLPRTFVTPLPMQSYATRERFLPLLAINSDVVGWLTIEGVLDLPVVQRDNAFYLTHNFEGKTSAAGTLFLDSSYSIAPPVEALLIHGHNMRDGSMFGQLLKYRKQRFYAKHWMIRFETLYEESNYVVFAAFDMVNDMNSPFYYPYNDAKFDTDRQFNLFIAGVRQRSLFQSEVNVLPTDALLLLSTCATGKGSYLVIVARKIREGESLQALTTACLMASF